MFVKDLRYWQRKAVRERECIQELEEKIPTLQEDRQIEAHRAYLDSIRKSYRRSKDAMRR